MTGAAAAPGVHPVGAHWAAASWLMEASAQVVVASARTRILHGNHGCLIPCWSRVDDAVSVAVRDHRNGRACSEGPRKFVERRARRSSSARASCSDLSRCARGAQRTRTRLGLEHLDAQPPGALARALVSRGERHAEVGGRSRGSGTRWDGRGRPSAGAASCATPGSSGATVVPLRASAVCSQLETVPSTRSLPSRTSIANSQSVTAAICSRPAARACSKSSVTPRPSASPFSRAGSRGPVGAPLLLRA